LFVKRQFLWTTVAAIWVSVAATAFCSQQAMDGDTTVQRRVMPEAVRAQDSPRVAEIRRIVLRSRHMGAHGMGYNEASLEEMSRKLTPADVAGLVTLMQIHENGHVRVGAQFGLASQCGAALGPVREAMINHQIMFLDAQDTVRLAAGFERCSPADRAKATATASELEEIYKADTARSREEAAKRVAEDQRIQENGLKLMDPAKAKTLTRAEREEVFARSVKAAGLDKEPLTEAQKKMVQQMYKTMVLGESGDRPPN